VSVKKRYSGYFTLTSSAAIAQGFMLLISPIITRIYGPEDIGSFGVIVGLGALIGSVGTGRLEHAIPVARDAGEAIQIAILGTYLALIASALAVLFALAMPSIGIVKDAGWDHLPMMAIPSIALSLAAFQVINALLLRQRYYGSVGANKIAQGFTTGTAQILLGWFGFGAAGLAWAQAIGYLSGGLNGIRKLSVRLSVVIRRRGLRLRKTFSNYKKFPLMLAPAALFNQASQYLPVLALGYVYGLYEAGLYALVIRVCGAPLGLLGQAVAQVYAAEFRTYLAGGGEQLAARYLVMLMRLLGMGVVVVGVMVAILSYAGTWLFGEKWANIGMVSLLLSPMLIMDFATTPISMTLGYLSRARVQLLWDIGRLLVIIVVFLLAGILSLSWGKLLLMLAGAWSISLLIHSWITYRSCYRHEASSPTVNGT